VEVVGDVLVDNGVAGICIQLKKAGWSVTVAFGTARLKTSIIRGRGHAKRFQRTVSAGRTAAKCRILRQHVCDLPLSCSFVSMSNVSVLGFRCRYLHLPIDFLERLKP
jgi:hypothetical protein